MLDLIAEPPTQELASTSVETTPAAPLTVPLGEAVDFESAFKKNVASFKANEAKKAQEKEKPVEQKQEDKPATREKPTEEVKDKPVEGKGESKPDPNYGKAKVQYSKLSPDQREYLLASEERRLAKLTETEDRAKKAEEATTALKARIKELEAIAETAPKERDEFKGKYETAAQEKARIERELMAANVLKSPEYINSVQIPFKAEVQDALVNFAKGFQNFDVALADHALRTGDVATLKAIRKSLPDEDDRADFRKIEDRALTLLAKHNEYVTKGADMDKELKTRRSTEEKQALETHKSEVNKAIDVVRSANIKRFSFLDAKAPNIDPALKKDLDDADAKIRNLDFNSLKPIEQARILEDAHMAVIAANLIDGYAGQVTKEKQALEAERDELQGKVADLERRLEAKGSVTMTPGRTGDAPRGVQAPAAPKNALEAFQQARRTLPGA